MKFLWIAVFFLFAQNTLAKTVDEELFLAINGVRHPILSGIERFSNYSMAIAPLTWAYIAWQGYANNDSEKKHSAFYAAGGVMGLVILNQSIKIGMQRERPIFALEEAQGGYSHSWVTQNILPTEKYSWPSQASSLAFFSAKYFGDELGYKPLWYSWAVLTAWGRIYYGAHYPVDVSTGALLGYGAAWLTQYLRDRKPEESTAQNLTIFPIENGLSAQWNF